MLSGVQRWLLRRNLASASVPCDNLVSLMCQWKRTGELDGYMCRCRWVLKVCRTRAPFWYCRRAGLVLPYHYPLRKGYGIAGPRETYNSWCRKCCRSHSSFIILIKDRNIFIVHFLRQYGIYLRTDRKANCHRADKTIIVWRFCCFFCEEAASVSITRRKNISNVQITTFKPNI